MTRSRQSATSDRPTLASAGRPVTIEAMTGVRALAALWVVGYHLRDPIVTLLPGARIIWPWLESGYLGVDVFFVLSGFIISYNYAERFDVLTRRAYRKFMTARFARTYPVHLLALLLTAGLVGYAAIHATTLDPALHYTPGNFVANLFMLQAVPGIDPWNIPSWSVSCEVAAYLVFPLVAGYLVRARRSTSWALIAAFMAAEVGSMIALSSTPVYPFLLYWARIMGEFSAGCLVWSLWRRSVRSRIHWDLAAVGAFGVVVVILSFWPLGSYTFAVVPFIVLFVASIPSAVGPVRTILSSRPLQWGGRISYSLYLVHTPVLVALFILHRPARFALAPITLRLGLVVTYFVIIIVAASMTYYFIEEPARKVIRRFGRRRPLQSEILETDSREASKTVRAAD